MRRINFAFLSLAYFGCGLSREVTVWRRIDFCLALGTKDLQPHVGR
jgi:hypothetical protein